MIHVLLPIGHSVSQTLNANWGRKKRMPAKVGKAAQETLPQESSHLIEE